MSFAKKFESQKVQLTNEDPDVRYKVFERLSQKGFLKSMQQQMRKAIAQELNETKLKTDEKEEEELDRNSIKEEEIISKSWESLAKVSSIANWEKQIRYELEIDREIQSRELERQKEKLKIEWRKLNERDKSLRIELDARERKIRLNEQDIKSNLEDVNQKLVEIAAKQEIINDIVNQKIKSQMKDEIDKLKKKFNELEFNKLNLTKREEKCKEVEQRLHEQAKVVKEKIDSKRSSEIELAKYRKDFEIIKKENEILKQRVESMGDYQLIKFENKSLKNELNAIKETLKNKTMDFESEREKWEKDLKIKDEKVLNLRMDLRKSDQELLLLKQKHQGDIDEYNNKFEHFNNQLKQSKLVAQQLAAKNHLLSKEIILSRNEAEKLMKINQKSSNTLTQTEIDKFGCHLCDHNIHTIEESSLELIASNREYISDMKRETQLVDEQNDLKLQSLTIASMPFMTNHDNYNSKCYDNLQKEVPLNSNCKTSSPITNNTINAIQNTLNTSAKHKTNQNGCQMSQTNNQYKQTNGKTLEDFEKYSNEKSKHYREKESERYTPIEDKDITEQFDW